MTEVPKCLCNEADMTACDWTVDVVVTVKRADPGSVFRSVSTTKQENLSMIEAANTSLRIGQGAISGIGTALIKEVEACYEAGQDPVALARKMLDLDA